MMLSDVLDFVESLAIGEHVYLGKLDAKQEKSIGIYNSKHEHAYRTAIGGPQMESYGVKYVTLLVHWNHSPRDTEQAAADLFNLLMDTRETEINKEQIKFFQLLTNGPVDVGTDEAGIYEMVIEAAVIYERRE